MAAVRRTLTLFRHGKSSWDDPGLSDHDRPLAPRGRKAVPRVTAWMIDHLPAVDVVLCSDARCTRQTLARAEEAGLRIRQSPQIMPKLYLASVARLLKFVRSLPDEARHAMIIGHNPGLHELALNLTGTGREEAISGLVQNLPTAALAVLQFDTKSWPDLKAGDGELRFFVAPRKLENGEA